METLALSVLLRGVCKAARSHMGNKQAKLRVAVYSYDVAAVEDMLRNHGPIDTEWTPLVAVEAKLGRRDLLEADKWAGANNATPAARRARPAFASNSPLNDHLAEGTWACLQLAVVLQATAQEKVKMVRALIVVGGALVNSRCDRQGTAALAFAADLADAAAAVALVQLLLDHGADPNGGGGQAPLLVAGRAGNLEALCVLLDRGADPARKDGHGWTVAEHVRKTKSAMTAAADQAKLASVLAYLDDHERLAARAAALAAVAAKQQEFAAWQAALSASMTPAQAGAWAQPAWQPGLYEECYGTIAAPL
jgi:hypothetical protein